MTTIPRITVTRHGSGWIVRCGKPGRVPHWEQFYGSHRYADQQAREHEKTCKEGR